MQGLFCPVLHCCLKCTFCFFRFASRDCIQKHSMKLEIVREIEPGLHGNSNGAEPKQRYYDPAEAFHQTIIVCRFPHGYMPAEVAPDVFLKVPSPGRCL